MDSSAEAASPGQPAKPTASPKSLVRPPRHNGLHPLVTEQRAKDIWTLLVIFRCVNALCVRTFFQPDEYYQSLEPAWQMAFGAEAGAWITWEWHHQLRSSLHPALFAVIYFAVDKPMQLLQFYPQFRAMILSYLPNLVQAYIAALGDFYTWQLAEYIHGAGSNDAWATLLMTVLSPWQWFCSTRTFSNCLETTLTIAALKFWPWTMFTDGNTTAESNGKNVPQTSSTSLDAEDLGSVGSHKAIKHLRIALLLASTACILRPTNGLIWFCVLMPVAVNFSSASSRLTTSDRVTLLREAIPCGLAVLVTSAVSDRLYFGEWTFPPYQWLNFNINQDLAVFYGRNDWHYYFSQGLPLLLTVYVPFTIIGLWKSTSLTGNSILSLLTTTVLVTLSTLSLIAHKEVRFIYPLLPLLHIITAPSLSSFFLTTKPAITPATTPSQSSKSSQESTTNTRRKPLLALLISANLLIAGYTTLVHQRGVLNVTRFLRTEYESLALDNRGVPLSSPDANAHVPYPKTTNYSPNETFVGFLMPCHSVPWRSQLIHPGLRAWALGCEPPIHLAPRTAERAAYRDEADRFYDAPLKFLREEISTRERPWPRFVVGFEGIGPVLREYYEGEMVGHTVRERWRGGNSQWHDDWRRTGDVVVWEFVDKNGE